ncbi:MAG: hypothetical protein ABL888_18640, partial [Pirellulaceae bacterium]
VDGSKDNARSFRATHGPDHMTVSDLVSVPLKCRAQPNQWNSADSYIKGAQAICVEQPPEPVELIT